MEIAIACEKSSLARAVGEVLQTEGYELVRCETRCVQAPEIHFGPDVSRGEALRLARLLDPIRFSILSAPSLPGQTVEILLGPMNGFRDLNFNILCEDEVFASEVAADVEMCGGMVMNVGGQVFVENSMLVGGADSFCCEVIRWFLERRGISVVQQKEWPSADCDVFLHLCDPQKSDLPLTRRYAVDVASDDLDVISRLVERLERGGFVVGSVTQISPDQAKGIGNSVSPGVFQHLNEDEAVFRLCGIADVVARDAGVDLEKHPVRLVSAGDTYDLFECGLPNKPKNVGERPRITLPTRACLDPGKPPTGGKFPERWLVVVRSEEPEVAAMAAEELSRVGFSRIVHQPLLKRQRCFGYQIDLPELGGSRSAAIAASRAMREILLRLGAAANLAPMIAKKGGDDDGNTIFIHVPSRGLEDGSLLNVIHGPGRHKVRIHHHNSESIPGDFLSALRKAGFESIETVPHRSVLATMICYGSASENIIAAIQHLVSRHLGFAIDTEQNFNEKGDNIYINIAEGMMTLNAWAASEGSDDDIDSYLEGVGATSVSAYGSIGSAGAHGFLTGEMEAADFLVINPETVTCGRLTLARRDCGDAPGEPGVPVPESFSHICIDGPAEETLAYIAASVALNEPCLLEGGNRNSRTSIILYLASLLRQPVMRVTLSSQTDVVDLVGRHAPARNGNCCSWENGPLVSAMVSGAWLVLDDLNLAKPQVLERLIPVMEQSPTLVLSEHDSRLIGGKAYPVHHDFRFFATLNPGGRRGPAWLDRWRGYA